jgi:hypothetical protein
MNPLPIIDYPLAEGQYFKEEYQKTQIYLHETAGRPSAKGVINGWAANPDKIGTCCVIGRKGTDTKGNTLKDGEIYRAFDPKYWAYHLGVTTDMFSKFGLPYFRLDKNSIGIELCNWGWLSKTDRGFESYAHVVVPDEEVCYLPNGHRGFHYFERFTEAQIDSLFHVLQYLGKEFGIPLTYRGDEIFDIDIRALKQEPGGYTHNSVTFPYQRCDITPQPEMITMLKSL